MQRDRLWNPSAAILYQYAGNRPTVLDDALGCEDPEECAKRVKEEAQAMRDQATKDYNQALSDSLVGAANTLASITSPGSQGSAAGSAATAASAMNVALQTAAGLVESPMAAFRSLVKTAGVEMGLNEWQQMNLLNQVMVPVEEDEARAAETLATKLAEADAWEAEELLKCGGHIGRDTKSREWYHMMGELIRAGGKIGKWLGGDPLLPRGGSPFPFCGGTARWRLFVPSVGSLPGLPYRSCEERGD